MRPNRRLRRSAHSGFGLLEAIVALTLIASAGMALFSWISTNMIGANRLRDIDRAAGLRMAAIETAANLNPLAHPDGRLALPRFVLEWRSTAASPLMEGAAPTAAGGSNFQVQLFRTRLRASDPVRGATVELELELAGYRTVRNITGGT